MITGIGHSAFEVVDLEGSVSYAIEVLGMRENSRSDGTVYLSHGPYQHSLEYREGPVTALDHVAMLVSSAASLDELVKRVEAAGFACEDSPPEPYVERSVRFAGPGGQIFDLVFPSEDTLADYSAQGQPPSVAKGVRPRRVGHVNLNFSDLPAAYSLFRDVLGFRESDTIVDAAGADLVRFLRCGTSHHAVGLAQGENGLFHYAFEVDTTQDLVRLGDALAAVGNKMLWGPGRHGAGDNIATYHPEPSGILIEVYAEMQLIEDDRWKPRKWAITDYRTNNVWGDSVDPGPLFECSIPVVGAR